MRKKKSRFLTFIFSMLPGAGHMYIGFMKIGVSFMSVFFFLIFLSSWLDIGPLLFIAPLIWFYSFFDCMNKASADEEQLSTLEDKYLFSIDKLANLDTNLFKKRRMFIGVIVLLLGIYLITENLMHMLEPYLSNQLYYLIFGLIRQTPRLIIGALIIAIGIKLIQGKKQEGEF